MNYQAITEIILKSIPYIFSILAAINSFLNNKKLKDIEFNNSLKIQRETFYKNIASNDIEELTNFWVNAISDYDNESYQAKLKDINTLKELNKIILLYGSRETLIVFGKFQQNAYSEAKNLSVSLLLGFTVFTSLKKDLTGENVPVSTFPKVTLKDYGTVKDDLKNIFKEHELEKLGFSWE